MGVLGVFFNFPEGTDTGIAFGFREVDQLAIGGGPDRWAWGDDGVWVCFSIFQREQIQV